MRRRAYGQGLRVIACALMAWQVWMVWHIAGYEASAVQWSCYGNGGCGSDQFASAAPSVGVASAVFLGFLAARFLHRAALGTMIALSAVACIDGWYDAVSGGLVGYGTVTDFHLFMPVARLPVSDWLTFQVMGPPHRAPAAAEPVHQFETVVDHTARGPPGVHGTSLEGGRTGNPVHPPREPPRTRPVPSAWCARRRSGSRHHDAQAFGGEMS
ncbi:hypothetical protein ACFT7S_37565 [Streptomyces sp. NPDC057136]|uniref:hypothetical protein n=1 Tax=Streptomyces sp. NPDC057136 TaxID=3346029 RepID=UPI003642ADB4